jgi:hypothetical protein
MRVMALMCAGLVLGACVMAPPAGGPLPVSLLHPNPTLVAWVHHELMWNQIVDVVDDYFRIQSELPVQQAGDVLTEGRIDTFPQGGATLLEPQRRDSVGRFNRWESTLQTIRRHAHLRVTPATGGFLVEVIVEKELEDLPRPERATAGASTFRNDTALERRSRDTVHQAGLGWIPLGRDFALEQQILSEIQARLGGAPPTGNF